MGWELPCSRSWVVGLTNVRPSRLARSMQALFFLLLVPFQATLWATGEEAEQILAVADLRNLR